jgi:hypothetical protein
MNDDRDLDRRLSEYGERWRTTQPAPPMPDLPSTTPLRRWLPVVAVAAAVALIAVGVTVAVEESGGDNSGEPANNVITPVDLTGAIPWIDTPAPTSDAATDCTSADLKLTATGTEGAAGTIYASYTVTNTSARTCIVRGPSQVTLSAPGKSDVVASATNGAGHVSLAPGAAAQLALALHDICTENPGGATQDDTFTTVTIDLPGNAGSLGLTDQQLGLNGCPVSHGGFTALPDTGRSTTARSVAELPVDVSLDMPSAAIAGDTLVYVTTLTNATEHKIQLVDDCPSYAGSLFDTNSERVAYGGYLLNCADAGSIPAKSSLRFEMHLDVPSDTAAGKHVLNWYFQGTDLPGAKTSIDVIASDSTDQAAVRVGGLVTIVQPT